MWILFGTWAWADNEDLRRAKQAYQYGKQMYDEAKYEEAIQAFLRAHDISQNHQLLFNLAMAYRMNDDLEKALSYFEEYQRQCNEDEWDQAQSHIESIEKKITKRQQEEQERLVAEQNLRNAMPIPKELPNWVIPSIWGLSAVGIGTGLYFGIESGSKTDMLDPLCANNICTGTASPIITSMRQEAMIADIASGIGLVAIGSALWLQFSQSNTQQISLTSNGVLWQGEF